MGDITTVELDEPEAVSDVLRQTYGRMRLRTDGDRLGLRMRVAQIGDLGFHQVRFGADVTFDVEVDPLNAYTLNTVTHGTFFQSAESFRRWIAPGDAFISSQPENPYSCSFTGYGAMIVMLKPDSLSKVAGPSAAGSPVRFTGYQPFSTAAVRSWTDVNHLLWTAIVENDYALESPLVVAHAERLLVASALATFPNDAIPEPTRVDRHDASPPTLRRVIAFIEQNVDRPLTMAEIAESAGVTVRAVQLAFRRHLDITPMAYLRRVRLAHAHADLVASDPTVSTVTAIAARWGFASPSTFAAYYREHYGQQPQRTLRGASRAEPPSTSDVEPSGRSRHGR